MKWILIWWVTIAQSEVNCHTQLNLTASEDVLQESVPLVEIEILKSGGLVLSSSNELVLQLAFPQHGYVASDVAQIYVFTTLLRLEKFNPNFSLWVFVRELWSQNRD